MTKGMIILSFGITGFILTVIWIIADIMRKEKKEEKIVQNSITNSRRVYVSDEKQVKMNDRVVSKHKEDMIPGAGETEFISTVDENYTELINVVQSRQEDLTESNSNQETASLVGTYEGESTQAIQENYEDTESLEDNYEDLNTESLEICINDAHQKNIITETEFLGNESDCETESLIVKTNEQRIDEKTESLIDYTECFDDIDNKTEALNL